MPPFRPWYCVPPRRERAFGRRAEGQTAFDVERLEPERPRRHEAGPLFFGTPTPLRRYERFGRFAGRGPTGYPRSAQRPEEDRNDHERSSQ